MNYLRISDLKYYDHCIYNFTIISFLAMPFINVITNLKLTKEAKRCLTKKLTSAFASSSSPEVSKAIQYSIQDDAYMNFQRNDEVPTASIFLHMSPYIPESDHENIMKAFFPILTEILNVPKENIYMCISVEPYWCINNIYINATKYLKK